MVDKTVPPGSTALVERAFARQPFSQFVRDVRDRHTRTQRLSPAQVEALERVVSGTSARDTSKMRREVELGITDWLASLRLTRKDVEQLAEMRRQQNPPPAASRFANIVVGDAVAPASSLEELRRRKTERT